MFDWICALTVDCLTCQNNKPKAKHKIDVPSEENHGEAIPFGTVHIDHKGYLHPPSTPKLHCLLGIDAITCFWLVYLITNTRTQTVINTIEKWMLFFRATQSIPHDRATAFINKEIIN